jgi:hypothetical protein
MMLDLTRYHLTLSERRAITGLLEKTGEELTLSQLWSLMDQGWVAHGCDNRRPDPSALAAFYADPVWLLNGIFAEHDADSLAHRRAIANTVASLSPQGVVDVGGGFGTLARMIASRVKDASVEVFEPYPPLHGVEACSSFSNIHYINYLETDAYDVLVSTDVLEHVLDPLSLLIPMVASVRCGGHLIIANCFYPVVACHMPTTFHLRFTFDRFCRRLGLEVLGPCIGSHAKIYRRARKLEPDWLRLRHQESWSQRLFPLREWRRRHLRPWQLRCQQAIQKPLHYPRAAWIRLVGRR